MLALLIGDIRSHTIGDMHNNSLLVIARIKGDRMSFSSV